MVNGSFKLKSIPTPCLFILLYGIISRTYSCLGRNVIRRQARHTRSAPGYCHRPASVSYIINDLPNCVNVSTIRLFTDDCLVNKDIHYQQDTEYLQTDPDALQTWERLCLMSCHPHKCQLLRITRKPYLIIAQYNIHGHVL